MNWFRMNRNLLQASILLVILSCFSSLIRAQGCDFLEDDLISLNIANHNVSGAYTQQYALTSAGGNILAITAQPSFPAQTAGNYFVYALNYETAAGVSGFSVGNNISGITGSCLDTTRLAANVCACSTDCHATDGTVNLSISGVNTSSDFTQSYALTDNSGTILVINTSPANLSPLFSGQNVGNYFVYALNYETAVGVNNYIVGNNIATVTSACLDVEGPICYNICQAPPPTDNYTGCNSNDGTISLTHSGYNQALDYTQSYALTDTNGIIQRIKDNPSNLQPLFVAVSSGRYRVYALNYETASSINNYSIGTSIDNVSGSCLDLAAPIYYEVCPCPFTGCNSTDGTITITNTGNNSTSDFTQVYALTDTFGLILATIAGNPSTNPLFSSISDGYYHIYGLNYETASGLNNFSIGNNIDNVSGACFDITGALCYQVCEAPLDCHSEDGTVSINSNGFNKEAGYTQSYALVDTNGMIQYLKDNPTNTQPLFVAVQTGTYELYALNYETVSGISNYTIGNDFSLVMGSCLNVSSLINYTVCPCPFTGCNSTDGVISLNIAEQNQTTDFTQAYALTDTFGMIIQTSISPVSTDSLFEAIPTGYYHIYAINYDTINGLTGLVVGSSIAAISGACFDITGALCYQVCNDTYDFGDLPDTSDSTTIGDYQTLLINNGPRHLIIEGLSLGDTIDMEVDGLQDVLAEGDGVDEDGLIIFPSIDVIAGMNFRLPFNYTNTTGDTAHIEGWIDWNADGDFDDLGEMVIDMNDANGNINNPIEFTVSSNALNGVLLGVRLRISLQDNMTPYGSQPNGEVEDYLLNLNCPKKTCFPITGILKR